MSFRWFMSGTVWTVNFEIASLSAPVRLSSFACLGSFSFWRLALVRLERDHEDGTLLSSNRSRVLPLAPEGHSDAGSSRSLDNFYAEVCVDMGLV